MRSPSAIPDRRLSWFPVVSCPRPALLRRLLHVPPASCSRGAQVTRASIHAAPFAPLLRCARRCSIVALCICRTCPDASVARLAASPSLSPLCLHTGITPPRVDSMACHCEQVSCRPSATASHPCCARWCTALRNNWAKYVAEEVRYVASPPTWAPRVDANYTFEPPGRG